MLNNLKVLNLVRNKVYSKHCLYTHLVNTQYVKVQHYFLNTHSTCSIKTFFFEEEMKNFNFKNTITC